MQHIATPSPTHAPPPFSLTRRALFVVSLSVAGVLLLGCEDKNELSKQKARADLPHLVELTKQDVEEVRQGLPKGAEILGKELKDKDDVGAEPEHVRKALETARGKVQDLRTAKATFFAVAKLDGTVVRNDQQQDLMAGKSLFKAFPKLAEAKSKYVETGGKMEEAAGVAGKPDAQWVAATPIQVGGQTKAVYAAGWSWSSYAYRLENALKSRINEAITDDEGNLEEKMPLYYVLLIADGEVYGKPVTPQVNLDAVKKLEPLKQGDSFDTTLEIDGRGFGLAVQKAPALGAQVAVAILRSET